MRGPLFLIACSVLSVVPGVFAAPPAKEIVIGPDPSVKVYKGNVFLAASDKQFKPIADLLDAATKDHFLGVGALCTTRVYKGMSSNADPLFQNPNYIVQAGDYRRDMLDSQERCVKEIQNRARKIGQDYGLLNNKNAWIKDSHVFDPRVYERAKKILGKTSPVNKTGKPQ